MNKTKTLLCAFIGLTPFAAMAEDPFAEMGLSLEDLYGDEEFVSIATGTRKPVYKAPSVATVITADEIKKMGANNVHQIIETVTGIHTYPSNFNRMNPSYSVRGIHTDQNSQVLVLVNGNRTTYEFTGAKFNNFDIGVPLIERIEVIRGPGSAIFGADAFAAVINIITKGNDNLYDNDMGFKAGSFNSKAVWINQKFSLGEVDTSFNAEWLKTEGDQSRVIQQDYLHAIGLDDLAITPHHLDTRREHVDLHVDLSYKTLNAKIWYQNNTSGTGAGAFQVLSDEDFSKNNILNIALKNSSEISPDIELSQEYIYQRYKSDSFFKIFPEGYSEQLTVEDDVVTIVYSEGFLGRPISVDTINTFKLTSLYTGFDRHKLRLEVGYQHSDQKVDEFKNFGSLFDTTSSVTRDGTLKSVKGTDEIFIKDTSRSLQYVSVQDEWSIANDWDLTGGFRYDKYSDFGSTLNPRLALVWQTKHNLTTKFLYGSAFRAPSFGDLYSKKNPVLVGNPELKPEKISTFEIAFDYRPTLDWQIIANLFSYEAKDLMDYKSLGNGISQLSNNQRQSGHGLELTTRWEPTTFMDLSLGYAYQSSQDKDSNTIADAPKQTIDASFSWSISDAIAIYLDSYFVFDRTRAPLDPRDNIDDYSVTNVNLTYSVNKSLSVMLSSRNIFNSNGREAATVQIHEDYPIESRSFSISLRFQTE